MWKYKHPEVAGKTWASPCLCTFSPNSGAQRARGKWGKTEVMTVPQHYLNHTCWTLKSTKITEWWWTCISLPWCRVGVGRGGGREMIQMRTISSGRRPTTNKKTQVFFFSSPEPFCSYRLLLFAPLWVQTFGKLWYYFTAAVKVSFLNIQMWKAIFGWFVNVGLWDMQSESQAFCNGFLVHSAWPLKPFLTRQLVQNKWYAGLQAVTFLSPSQLAGCGLRVIFCPYAYSQPLTMSWAFGSQGERHPGLLSPAFHHLHVPGKMPFLYHCWVLWPHQHRSARKC